jgi:DNA polymerase-3 subunit gamma/tau
LPEAERQAMTDLADIKIPALSRAWQILLKGIGEVQTALHPAEAAEMVLIRIAYASELPPPSDLIRQLRNTAPSQSPQTSAPSGPPQGGARAIMGSGNSGGAVRAVSVAAVAAPAAAHAPETFREVVALFAEKREAALQAQLYRLAHPVRCEAGILEIRLKNGAEANFVNRVGQCLTHWTGRMWMVSVTDQSGGATLEEEENEAERKRLLHAEAHPLMQAVMLAFPDAKLTSLRQKAIAPAPAVEQDEDEIVAPVAEFDE